MEARECYIREDQALASLRERLVETKKRLATPIQEFEDVGNLAMAKLLTKTIKSSLAAIEPDGPAPTTTISQWRRVNFPFARKRSI